MRILRIIKVTFFLPISYVVKINDLKSSHC